MAGSQRLVSLLFWRKRNSSWNFGTVPSLKEMPYRSATPAEEAELYILFSSLCVTNLSTEQLESLKSYFKSHPYLNSENCCFLFGKIATAHVKHVLKTGGASPKRRDAQVLTEIQPNTVERRHDEQAQPPNMNMKLGSQPKVAPQQTSPQFEFENSSFDPKSPSPLLELRRRREMRPEGRRSARKISARKRYSATNSP